MALKLTIDKLDDVDESLRSLYEEKDGKFHLAVDGIEDASGLRSALGTERKARAELERKVKRWEKIGKTEEEIAELIAKHEEAAQTEAERKGEWDKLRAQMNEKHAQEIKAKETENAAMRKALERHLVDAQATAAIAQAKGIPTLLLPHVQRFVKVVEDNGDYSVKVVDAKGDPRVNGKGEPLSVADLVNEMRSTEVFGRAFESSGNSGSGMPPGSSNGGGIPRNIKRSDLKDNKAISAFVEAHGLEAYKALA